MNFRQVRHDYRHETVRDVIDLASGERAIRRSAGRSEFKAFFDWRVFLKLGNAVADGSPTDTRCARLRMSPLRGRYRAAAIMVAAAGIANSRPRGILDRPAVARMRRLADTAGTWLLGC
jgi:hypothetical protein